MLIICEDCAKKYNIDEGRIKGSRARFTCKECGHIIIVNKDDLTRALINGVKSGSSHKTSSSADLPGEMESAGDTPPGKKKIVGKKIDDKNLRRRPFWKYRGIPIALYFLIIMLFTLVCVTLVTSYLYSEHLYSELLADVFPTGENYRDKLMIKSALVFAAAWMFILLVLTIVGRKVHASFSKLVSSANQLALGQQDIDIIKDGPREVRDLGYALERIRQRCKSGQCQTRSK